MTTKTEINIKNGHLCYYYDKILLIPLKYEVIGQSPGKSWTTPEQIMKHDWIMPG